jgi:hypothetical protein
MARIAFEDKESTRSSSLPAKNQVKDADLNEIKTSVNSLYDDVDAIGVDVAAIVGNAPANLDTLEEIANSIGNDPDFITTVGNAIGNKEDALPTMVGASLKVLRVNAGETAKEWWEIESGLTIGTTAITSGTNTRVLYQSAGVVTQSANFVFDASNQLVIGGHTGGARIDVKCGGALSTDLGLRVRNSVDTLNILEVRGDKQIGIRDSLSIGDYYGGNTKKLYIYSDSTHTYAQYIDQNLANSYGSSIINRGTGAPIGLSLSVYNGTTNSALQIVNGDIEFNTTTGTKIGMATNQKLSFWNATPIVQPTTSVASATLTGGGGATITDTDTFDGYTLKQIVKALRNSGLLA